ncbi:AAA family ATPase [Evansella sp. AB-rgal1]|uniref:ATP-binding protein n=1 Tax=Evansella sp. AB-rgal1 TaxID=3242696 RepID=UPI00359D4453
MKIRNVHIHGYGKWKNETWDLCEEGIHLFCGKNESGKSTLMSFIEAILFGFPRKGENQYIPMVGDAYGGAITIVDENNDEVVIERVKGRKAKGDVTVYFSDGRTSDDSALESLLSLDQSTFRGIFCFDLDGLNGLGKMNPEELHRFLYDTGLGGGQTISQLEKKLEGEMEQLFKPKGKKTEMNLLAKKLEEKEREIIKWEERLDQFELLQKQVIKLDEQISQNKETKSSLLREVKEAEKHEVIVEVAKKWQEKQYLLEQESPVVSFPQNGLQRLDTFNEKITEKQSLLRDEQVKQKLLDDDIEGIKLHPSWTIWKNEIPETLQQFEVYRQRDLDRNENLLQVNHLLKKKNEIEEEWNKEGKELNFSLIPSHPLMKTTFYQMKEQWNIEKETKKRVLQELEKLENEVAGRKNNIDELHSQLVPIEEVKKLEDNIVNFTNGHSQLEKRMLTDRLLFLKNQKQEHIKRETSQINIFLILALVFLFSSIYSAVINEMLASIIGGVLSVFFFCFTYWKKTTRKNIQVNYEKEENTIQGKINELQKNAESFEQSDIERWKDIVSSDKKNRAIYTQKKEQLQLVLQQKIESEKRLHQCDNSLSMLRNELNLWTKKYHLPDNLDFPTYAVLLQVIDEWIRHQEHLEQKEERMKQLQENQRTFERKLNSFLKRIGYEEQSSVTRGVELCKIFLREQNNKEKVLNELQQFRKHRRETISRLEVELADLKKEKQLFVHSANVTTEEEFSKLGETSKRQQTWTEERNQLWAQMKVSIPDEQNLLSIIQKILMEEYAPVTVKQQMMKSLDLLEKNIEEQRDSLATIKKEIAFLQQEGSYEECKLLFFQLKEEMQSLLKRWGTASLSLHILQEVKRIYEMEKQPLVLKEAERLFSLMTNGIYRKVLAPLGEQKFVLVRHDGKRFDPSEVSRGTCELLYLSFRFSLALTYKKDTSFPLIMDETLVNLDRERRENVMKTLIKIGEKRQILFFTCHHHIEEELNRVKVQKMEMHV